MFATPLCTPAVLPFTETHRVIRKHVLRPGPASDLCLASGRGCGGYVSGSGRLVAGVDERVVDGYEVGAGKEEGYSGEESA